MRAVVLLVLLSACDVKPASAEVVDISRLDAASPAAARDLQELIGVDRGRLSRCVDPFRSLVRRGPPGYDSVGVVLGVVGRRGGELEIRSASIDPRFGPAFDVCVASVLRGTAPIISSGDYALNVRLHLCIDPQGAP